MVDSRFEVPHLNQSKHMREDEQSWEVLTEEHRATVKAYQNKDIEAEKESEELTQRLIRLLSQHEGDFDQKIRKETEHLQNVLNDVEKALSTEEKHVNELHDMEVVWKRVKSYINFLYGSNLSAEEILTGRGSSSGNKYPQNITLPDTAEVYNLKLLNKNLSDFEKIHLRPILGDLQSTEEGEEIRRLVRRARDSINQHSVVIEYKKILEIALYDEELQKNVAKQTNHPELMRVAEQEEKDIKSQIEGNIRQLEQEEQRYYYILEDIVELLSKKIEVEDEVIEEMKEYIGEPSNDGFLRGGKDLVSGILGGSNTGQSEKLLPQLEEMMTREYRGSEPQIEELEMNFNQSHEHLQNIINSLKRVRSEEERNERMENKAIEELAQYINFHRQMTRISEDLSDASPEEVTESELELEPNGNFEDVTREHPDGFNQFRAVMSEIDKYENEFDHLKNRFSNTEEEYKKIYRLNEDEIDNLRDFEERLNHLETGLRSIHDQLASMSEEELEKIRKNRSRDLVEGWMEFEGKSLQKIIDDAQKIKADIIKIEKDEEIVATGYAKANQDLEEVLEIANELSTLLSRLVDSVNYLKNPNTGKGSKYTDAVYIYAKRNYTDEGWEEAREIMVQKLKSLKNELQFFKEKEKELEELMQEEVKQEQVEEEEIKHLIEEIIGQDGVHQEINALLNPRGEENLEQFLDDELEKKLNKVQDVLKSIAEELKVDLDKQETEERRVKMDSENVEKAINKGSLEANSLDELLDPLDDIDNSPDFDI